MIAITPRTALALCVALIALLWVLNASPEQTYLSRFTDSDSAFGQPAPLLSAPVVPLSPQQAPLPRDDNLVAAIDGYLSELVGAQKFQGTVLVARNGQVLLSKGYGPADAETGEPNQPQTRMRLASVSKQFTATAIMLLQAQGRLNVNDPICVYIANCPPAWQPITIHHLLNHTSGLPNYTDFGDFEATEMLPTSPDQLVARFHNLPLSFAPGERFSYNNSGYVLLGIIVERVSGQPFADFVQQRIFGPLGMQNSGVDQNAGTIVGQAAGHEGFGIKASFLDTSTLFGAGSIYSTVEDLYRWDQALYTNTPLPQAARDLIFTPGQGNYGYGWWITAPNGHRVISHPGNMEGFATYIARYPDDRVTVIVLANMANTNSEAIGDTIANMVLR